MSKDNISVDDLPSPDEILSADELPSPEELKSSLPQKIVKNVASTAKSIATPVVSGSELIAEPLVESALDTAKGVSQGITMGAADELGGFLSAAAESLYNKFDPTNIELEKKGFKIEKPGFSDLYRQNQQMIQKEYEQAQERSPWLYTGGQIAGGVASGKAVGGLFGVGEEAAGAKKLLDIAKDEGKLKALSELGIRGIKTYKQALPIMLTEAALSSKEGGVLTPEERSKLTEDVAGAALFGLPVTMGLQAVTDVAMPMAAQKATNLKTQISDYVEDIPLFRQMKVAYEYGKEGINPKSQTETLKTELGKVGLSELDNERTQKLMNEIYDAQQRVGKSVSDSLINSTKKVDLSQDIIKSLDQVNTLATKYPEIVENSRAQQIFGKIASGQTQVTPVEAKDLIDYMDSYINKFKASTNKTPGEEGILSNLYQARKQFSNTLKSAVPEYAAAAERFSQFQKLVPETILAGNRPVDVKDEFFSQINNQDMKLFDQLKRLNQGTTKQGEASKPVREAFVNTIKGLKKFEQQEAERLASGKIQESAFKRTASDIEKEIKKNADDAVARSSMDSIDPHTGVPTSIGKAAASIGETGRATSLSAANIAGRMSKGISQSTSRNPVSRVASAIYNAPEETVLSLSNKLKTVPGLQKYGDSLEKALASKDMTRRNQILFTIMQNPSARAFVDNEQEITQPTE